MIVGCSLLGSIQPYLWAYNPTTDKCSLRPHAEALWEVWSWTTEMIVFFVVPLVILIVNVLVMREVWRMSKSGPVAGPALSPAARDSIHSSRTGTEARHSSVYGGGTSKNAATNAMLLTVSFYVIFTTLPATLVYVLANAFPEVRPTLRGACAHNATMTTELMLTDGLENQEMVSWRRYVVYATVRNIINEICLSHYACNFFFYVVTGREFRSALRRLCGRPVTGINRNTENGTRQCGQGGTERTHPGNDQRVPLTRI